jgi:hypothetical protein
MFNKDREDRLTKLRNEQIGERDMSLRYAHQIYSQTSTTCCLLVLEVLHIDVAEHAHEFVKVIF